MIYEATDNVDFKKKESKQMCEKILNNRLYYVLFDYKITREDKKTLTFGIFVA